MNSLFALIILLQASFVHAFSGAPSAIGANTPPVKTSMSTPVAALNNQNCVDLKDTFSKYDDHVKKGADIPATYYLMSYSWAPNYCAKEKYGKEPGERDYLQCGSSRNFGYILHGLWPQGVNNSRPRACEGNVEKIDRAILEKYLCMTPSIWLLQHEYEYHGTCMHDEALEDPQTFFDIAMELHSQMSLPGEELQDSPEDRKWWLDNNDHLFDDAFYYASNGKEWRFCYDIDFKPMPCPPGSGGSRAMPPIDCNDIKGNVNKKGKKYYFTQDHPGYAQVKIHQHKGERCFSSVQKAEDAGWVKAP
ncbi:MAG: hypothetical protein LGR52_11045 [Candidatus Thiosymbion ectosymbiont of Robbea hypermnestra]|nr:hypothetical protein [Candidatus Thiosymbion ectosymbiont of Robbea hypermnestra]